MLVVYMHGQQDSPHIILMLRYVHGAYSFAEACMCLQSVFVLRVNWLHEYIATTVMMCMCWAMNVIMSCRMCLPCLEFTECMTCCYVYLSQMMP